MAFGAVVLLYLCAAGVARHYQDGVNKRPQFRSSRWKCDDQEKHREEELKTLKLLSDAIKLRVASMEAIAKDDKHGHFLKARESLEAEKAALGAAQRKEHQLRIRTISESIPSILGLIMGSMLFYLLFGRLVLWHARTTVSLTPMAEPRGEGPVEGSQEQESIAQCEIMNQGKTLESWGRAHAVMTLLIASFMIIAELFTSVLATAKTWFGWDSFCITPEAFLGDVWWKFPASIGGALALLWGMLEWLGITNTLRALIP